MTPPVACPLALPRPLVVDPSACTLLELLPALLVEVEVGGAGRRGLWEEPDVDGGGCRICSDVRLDGALWTGWKVLHRHGINHRNQYTVQCRGRKIHQQ